MFGSAERSRAASSAGSPTLENIFETAGILAGDAIAARCLGHGGFERDGRGLEDIVALRASEPGRRRASDGAEGKLGVLDIERVEHLRERGAKIGRLQLRPLRPAARRAG